MSTKRIYEEYKRGDVVYADLGSGLIGVEGGLRPCIVVSRDESNHKYASQITICPLSAKLKKILVHVKVEPDDVQGYRLKTTSDFLPECIQTISKSAIRAKIGCLHRESMVRDDINRAIIIQLGLYPTVEKMVREELSSAEKC